MFETRRWFLLFPKTIQFQTISIWHYNKTIFQSIKIISCNSKVHFFNTMALILFFLILILISIIQPTLVAKTFFHVHQMNSNLFVSITFIFLLSLRQEKYKITLFDFYFLVDMQSKFSCVKTMRRTSDSSSVTYTWRRLFVLIS